MKKVFIAGMVVLAMASWAGSGAAVADQAAERRASTSGAGKVHCKPFWRCIRPSLPPRPVVRR